jgi:hypothetical protein
MSDDMMFLVGGIAGVVVLLAILAYNAVRGVHGNLSIAKIGEVYNFEYEQPYQGDAKRVLARVIEPVHKLDDGQIRRLNLHSRYRSNDPVFQRTHHLVTCEMPTGEIRQFYAERAKNVRRTLIPGRFMQTAAAALL